MTLGDWEAVWEARGDMNLIEYSLEGKVHDVSQCEDGIVATPNFVAVIDGATDKTGFRFQGLTGGLYAMRACAEAVKTLCPDATAIDAVAVLTGAVAEHLPADMAAELRPSASVAMYSVARREVWQIGDAQFWYQGLAEAAGRGEKLVDTVTASLRAGILNAELLRGISPETLLANDIGRDAIMPLLTRQGIFCNNVDAGEWAFAAINGLPVPAELLVVHPVPGHVTELVLASDGYPVVLPTLAKSEVKLSDYLEIDPLCIGPLRSTKGMKRYLRSFDDRAYVRLRLMTR